MLNKLLGKKNDVDTLVNVAIKAVRALSTILKDGSVVEMSISKYGASVNVIAPNKACTRLEAGAANADSESNPAVSSENINGWFGMSRV